MSAGRDAEPPVLLDRQGALATVTLNRPGALNAIDRDLADALLAAVIDCDHDDALRAVLVTGRGRAFSAGGDVRRMRAEAAPDGTAGRFLKDLTARLHAVIATIARMPKPVVMAVNGPVAGAGFALALAGDLVVAAVDARFTLAYTAVGLAPDGGSTYFLPRLIGIKRAFELIATNRTLSPREARDLGLINEIFPDAGFAEQARDYAAKLAEGPTRALGAAKKLLASSADSGLETQMEHERRAIAATGGSDDFVQGLAAFLDRRPARFSGR